MNSGIKRPLAGAQVLRLPGTLTTPFSLLLRVSLHVPIFFRPSSPSTGETSPAVAQSDAHPTAQASQSSAPKAPARQTRLLISTDMYIDKDNNEVVVILELPGLNKSSVRINLVTCPYSGCRQLAVQARSRSTVPDGPIAVRERKTGDCHRTIFVPLSTKVRVPFAS